jgi:flavin-dependent dehydrogenase
MVVVLCAGLAAGQQVNQSARQLPVAYDVDVLVVGGSTGAVSAAVAAAQRGAQVFLAAPHPYLGEDMTATLQLWLEDGEQPTTELARSIYHDPLREGPDPNRLPFQYEADVASAALHRDSSPPSRLNDGKWFSAAGESVQYDANADITLDLESAKEIREIRLMAFRRDQGGDAGSAFDVERVDIAVSQDGQRWEQLATMRQAVVDSEGGGDRVITFSTPITAQARYVRLAVEKPADIERMLLGEIEVIGPPSDPVEVTAAASPPPRPMHVKKTLDDALVDAGVQYLYSCYATDLVQNSLGQPCGVIMANRAGRQAVLAKVIIDATPQALVARMAGAELIDRGESPRRFKRVVIGGQLQQGDAIQHHRIIGSYASRKGSFPIIEYTLELPVPNDSYDAWMRADQYARSVTYHPDQQYTSDVLLEVAPPKLRCDEEAGPAADVGQFPLSAFQPAGMERFYVIGGPAGVSRKQAEQLLRPVKRMALGERIGRAAAKRAKSLPAIQGAVVAATQTSDRAVSGDVQEFLAGVRPVQTLPKIAQQASSLPVLGTYDVVVVGGGTGGAPAGIAAARRGAKTLVVEYLNGLGGVGTFGAISKYYWGNRVGFTATVLDGATSWEIEQKKEWYRRQLLDAGGEVWFGCLGCGVVADGQRVTGAVVATPFGRGVVLARTVIDATGNSDIAAAAGAETLYTDASEFGMQGTGLPGRRLGGSYNNTDFTIVDESDMVDMWHVMVYAKDKYPQAFDQGQLIDTRERRRIIGHWVLRLADQLNERTYPDSVVHCWSNFDTHGYTIDPLLLLEHPEKKGVNVFIPYRALVPRGVEGMLVTGLSISAHRDAVPLIRMQPDIQNGGYAAGLAAAMAAQSNVPVHQIDVRELQRELVAIGNLPESVLRDQDSYPLPEERIAAAVNSLPQGRGAAVITTHWKQALPRLKDAFAKATGDEKLAYAKALAIVGQDTGLAVILDAVRQTPQWDQGWNYRGMGQFGTALSPLDTQIVALGYAGDVKAVPAIVEKLQQLDADSDFSHHRAVALALELIGDGAAAQPLATLLAKPGMQGHVHMHLDVARQHGVPGGTNAVVSRRESLRELLLARALYCCGDHDGLGERILKSYTEDLRGHFARHAQATLEQPRPKD